MALAEFQIIQKYFSELTFPETQNLKKGIIEKGIGDDTAVLDISLLQRLGSRLLVSADTLSEGTHFLPQADPQSLGFKALAVNVSDILAMGGKPLAFTLCLSLPSIDHSWLERFSAGLGEAARMYGVSLIGGDTTRGVLSMSVQIFGTCYGQPLLRSGAQPGDMVAVTGTLGDSAAGLQVLLGNKLNMQVCSQSDFLLHRNYLVERHCKPTPRQGLTSDIVGLRSAIDISDGFIFDLEHICNASSVQAIIDPNLLPLSPALQLLTHDPLHYALIGGEDYELCLVFDPCIYEQLQKIAVQDNFNLTTVGFIEARQDGFDELVVLQGWSDQEVRQLKKTGFSHFTCSDQDA